MNADQYKSNVFVFMITFSLLILFFYIHLPYFLCLVLKFFDIGVVRQISVFHMPAMLGAIRRGRE